MMIMLKKGVLLCAVVFVGPQSVGKGRGPAHHWRGYELRYHGYRLATASRLLDR
jgi:hypothetical protein